MTRENIPEYIVWALVTVIVAVIVYAFVQGIGVSNANRMVDFLKACKSLNETLTDGQCQAILALSRGVSQ